MLKTLDYINKTFFEIRLLLTVYRILQPTVLLFSVIYQTYMFSLGGSMKYAHFTLLILALANFAFALLANILYEYSPAKEKKQGKRKMRSIVSVERRVYKIATYSIRILLIAASIVSIVENPGVFSIVATVIIATELLIELIIFSVTTMLTVKFNTLKALVLEDFERIKEAVISPIHKASETASTAWKSTKGFFGRLLGRSRRTADEDIDFTEDTETV